MLYFKNQQEKQLFSQMMARYDKSYDEQENALAQWRGEHGYHSTLVNQFVHSTRDSLAYAFELYNRDEQGDRSRAEKILRRIIPLQDVDPIHKTYGIWSYYTEEPLEQMAPPDWNWADFCGKELMHILLDHKEKLSSELENLVKTALLHACNSIRIRDMEPGYTNISMMGTYVTMVGGTLLNDRSLTDYSTNRLKILYRFNMDNGAYKEYNSPTYTLILASDLARMMKYVKDPDAQKLLNDLNNLAWEGIARHYHFKTKQWAGPHARAYTMLQNKELLMKIQRALDYQISLVDLKESGVSDLLPMDFFSVDLRCPKQFIRYFTEVNKEAEINQAFFKKDIATAYITENFTLGNFYQSTFWNQKRNMLCYFGDEKKPAYCALKVLHDFYDYSSGIIVSAQQKNRSVALVNFMTDGGDTHCNLDMVKNATITASDFRIRFELGGGVENLSVTQQGKDTFLADNGTVKIKITIPYVKFGDYPVSFEIGESDAQVLETGTHKDMVAVKFVDIILYHGEKTSLCFSNLDESVCGICFEITDANFSEDKVLAGKKEKEIFVSMGNLQVRGKRHCVPYREFLDTFTAWIDGSEYQDIYCKK